MSTTQVLARLTGQAGAPAPGVPAQCDPAQHDLGPSDPAPSDPARSDQAPPDPAPRSRLSDSAGLDGRTFRVQPTALRRCPPPADPARRADATATVRRRAGFAEIADPVVVGVAGAVFEPERLAATARLAPAEPSARLWRRGNRKRSARVLGSKPAGGGRTAGAIAVGGYSPASPAVRPGLVGIGVGPPQILLVLRPSRGHNDWYS